MNTFGIPGEFEIQYELLPDEDALSGILDGSWGMLKLIIMGKDICAYRNKDGEHRYFKWNLHYIVEWLCENIESMIGHDPFPLPVSGQNILEMIKKADQFEVDDFNEINLWFSAKISWLFRHSWFSCRGGAILSNVIFRRIDDEIEICWDNDFWSDSGIAFVESNGCYVISKIKFKKYLLEFLFDIIDKLKVQYASHKSTNYQKQLEEWVKSLKRNNLR